MNEQILNWKQAAIAWGEGKKVEWAHISEWRWNDLADEPKFLECLHYRLKPEAVTRVDSGKRFKLYCNTVCDGDFAMSPNLIIWYLNTFLKDQESLKSNIKELKEDYESKGRALADLQKTVGMVSLGPWPKNTMTLQEVRDENEQLRLKLKATEICHMRAMESLKEKHDELSQVKEERDRLRAGFITFESKDSNDKQPTPTEKTDNIPHSFASLNDRIERVENKLIKYGYY